jgi:hypothetical protein
MLRAWEFSGDIACVNVTANGHDATVALMTYILERENRSRLVTPNLVKQYAT